MTDNVFDQNTNNPPIVQPPVSSDPFADKLNTIVNEQGQPKYKDTTTALEALRASQDHIKRLEDEAKARQVESDKFREVETRASALEEIVTRLTNNSPKPSNVETPTKAGLDEEAIVKQLETIVSSRETRKVAEANVNTVQNALITKFGEKTKEIVASKAAELGLTPSELGALSSKSPKAVLQIFGLEANITSTANPVTPSQTPLNPPKPENKLERPALSLISGAGATDKNRRELMSKIKEEVYKKYSVEI